MRSCVCWCIHSVFVNLGLGFVPHNSRRSRSFLLGFVLGIFIHCPSVGRSVPHHSCGWLVAAAAIVGLIGGIIAFG